MHLLSDQANTGSPRCPTCKGSQLRVFERRLVCDRCEGMMIELDDFTNALGTTERVELVDDGPGSRKCPRCLRNMRACRLTVGPIRMQRRARLLWRRRDLVRERCTGLGVRACRAPPPPRRWRQPGAGRLEQIRDASAAALPPASPRTDERPAQADARLSRVRGHARIFSGSLAVRALRRDVRRELRARGDGQRHPAVAVADPRRHRSCRIAGLPGVRRHDACRDARACRRRSLRRSRRVVRPAGARSRAPSREWRRRAPRL